MSEYGTPRRDYTVWCRQSNGEGTMWIGNVKASDHRIAGDTSDIVERGIDACAEDWGWQDRTDEISCIGIAEGDVEIVEWNDEEF